MSRVLDLVLAGTTAQFDQDASLATTEFVQRALGNSRGFVGLTANTALTAEHCGRDVYASTTSGAITLTLPAANSLPAGAKFKIINTGVDNVIVSRAGSDTIVVNNTTNAVTSVTLRAGDSIELTSLGSGTLWYHSGGSAQLGRTGAFGASLAANGWQRLPSGLVVQWGAGTTGAGGTVTVTWPLAFASACYLAMGTRRADAGAAGGSITISAGTPTTSNCSFVSRNTSALTGSVAFHWISIGQ